jgi:integrase
MGLAYDRGLLARDPCAGVVIPRPRVIDEEGPRALSRSQVQALLRATPTEWRTLIRFAVESGCRISEIVALQFKHLDLDSARPTVRIRRAYVRRTMGPPKSRHGVRTIPLSAGMAEELRALRERVLGRKVRVAPIEEELVFATGKGTLLDQKNLRSRVLQRACRKAKIPVIGWHCLRHTCGSLLLDGGANVKQVQKHLGHHAASFTLDVYVHTLPDDSGPVLDMGEWRGKQTPPEAAGADLKVVGG